MSVNKQHTWTRAFSQCELFPVQTLCRRFLTRLQRLYLCVKFVLFMIKKAFQMYWCRINVPLNDHQKFLQSNRMSLFNIVVLLTDGLNHKDIQWAIKYKNTVEILTRTGGLSACFLQTLVEQRTLQEDVGRRRIQVTQNRLVFLAGFGLLLLASWFRGTKLDR